MYVCIACVYVYIVGSSLEMWVLWCDQKGTFDSRTLSFCKPSYLKILEHLKY